MTDDERMQNLEKLAKLVTADVLDGLRLNVKTCINCEFWQDEHHLHQPETCRNVINCPQSPARPPARIIAFGCDHYKVGAPF